MLIPARLYSTKERRLLVSKAIYPIWIATKREISSSNTLATAAKSRNKRNDNKKTNNTCSTYYMTTRVSVSVMCDFNVN